MPVNALKALPVTQLFTPETVEYGPEGGAAVLYVTPLNNTAALVVFDKRTP